MTPDRYRTAIKKLGLSQVAAAKFFGVNERTCRYWIKRDGDAKIPEAVSKLLRLMIRLKIGPEEV